MILVDTGPLVAMANVRDEAHIACTRLLEDIPGPLLVPAPVRRDPTHARTWIALVDGNNHQINRFTAEARARDVTRSTRGSNALPSGSGVCVRSPAA